MKSLHVKKGDTVKILTGKDRGKTGTILKALPREGRVVVEGLNMMKKAVKGQGIVEIPRPIDVSNVAPAKEEKKVEKKTTKKVAAKKTEKKSEKKEEKKETKKKTKSKK